MLCCPHAAPASGAPRGSSRQGRGGACGALGTVRPGDGVAHAWVQRAAWPGAGGGVTGPPASARRRGPGCHFCEASADRSPRPPASRRVVTPPHLVRQPGDEHVPAHGRVLVHEAGALLAALVLPQQTRPVNDPAEGDGPRDAPCRERLGQHRALGGCAGPRPGHPFVLTRQSHLRGGDAGTGPSSGLRGDDALPEAAAAGSTPAGSPAGRLR